MRARDAAALTGAVLAASGAQVNGTFDWTAVLVALIGLTGVVTAAFLARAARHTETRPAPAADLVHAWQDVVSSLRDELERAVKERDKFELAAESAIGERNMALMELRACKRHDHGDLT